MPVRDQSTRDLRHQPLRLASDVSFWPVRERGQVVYRLEVPSLRRFYRVGYAEYVLISMLDGSTTIPQAAGLAAAKLGKQAPSTAAAESIARWLLANELAYLCDEGEPLRGQHQESSKRLWERLNPFWIHLPLPKSEPWMALLADKTKHFCQTPFVLLGCCVILFALVTLAAHWTEFKSSIALFHPSNWFWLGLIWISLKCVHELAHASACHYHGGRVGKSGFVLVLFAPMAFVDVTSCWRMNSRWSRISVSAAGMFIEALIAAVATLIWAMTESSEIRFLSHNIVWIAGISTLLFNLNPLMRFDGYYILADAIDIPNLWSESSRSALNLFKRLIVGRSESRSEFVGWRKPFVHLYAVAVLSWRITICFSLLIAASVMFSGAGILITALGIMLWVGRPATGLVRWANDLRVESPAGFVRATLISGGVVCVASLLLTCVPIPTGISAPAIVRYLPETNVRARADGFVVAVLVKDGDWVRDGDLLVQLHNPDLTSKLKDLQLMSEQNQIRLKQATKEQDAAAQRLILDNQETLAQQISLLQSQVVGLRITAARTGRVIAPEIQQWQGKYLHAGESIMNVASEADKEVVAMIDQDDIQSARRQVGKELAIRSVGYRPLRGTLTRIEPGASPMLQEPALAATHGGTLVVESVDPGVENVRLTQPYFRARIGLQRIDANCIATGIRTTVFIGHHHETIARRLQHLLRDTWDSARIDVHRGI